MALFFSGWWVFASIMLGYGIVKLLESNYSRKLNFGDLVFGILGAAWLISGLLK